MQFSQISYQTRSFPFFIFETSAIPSPMLPAGVGAPAQCPTARPPPPAPPSPILHAAMPNQSPKLVTRGLPQEASSCELPPDMAAMAAERWVANIAKP